MLKHSRGTITHPPCIIGKVAAVAMALLVKTEMQIALVTSLVHLQIVLVKWFKFHECFP